MKLFIKSKITSPKYLKDYVFDLLLKTQNRLYGLFYPKIITVKKVDNTNKHKNTLQKYENPHVCQITKHNSKRLKSTLFALYILCQCNNIEYSKNDSERMSDALYCLI